MKDVVSVKVMRESDKNTIENVCSSKELMYRAGKGVFESVDWSGRTAIVCGSGNNAGDGYVLALLLKEHDSDCKIILLSERFSEDGRYYFDKCVTSGVEYEIFNSDTDFSDFDNIADCIFGTGFRGEVEGCAKEVIDKINSSGKKVISVDINSGLNGDSGLGEGAVVSDVTVSIGTMKSGHFLNMAKDKRKEVKNCDIGIEIIGEKYYLFEKEDAIFEKRLNYSHKGAYGYTAIMGGCAEYLGAAKLANLSLASLKAGCGVNRLIVPEEEAPFVMGSLLESTLFKMPSKDGKAVFDEKKLDEAFSGIKAAAIGMGWGASEEYEKILKYVSERFKMNLVIDADGLNTLAKTDKSILKKTECKVCLTPHVKEFERLSGYSRKEISENGIECAKSFARENSVVLLLKGTTTIVTDGNEVYLVDRGCPGMATAGSGDVLSGILCGILGSRPLTAKNVALGAYIAGRAGEEAEQEKGAVSMTSSDTVNHISDVIKELM
jgi:NAD(P)H-hydrate epimerase